MGVNETRSPVVFYVHELDEQVINISNTEPAECLGSKNVYVTKMWGISGLDLISVLLYSIYQHFYQHPPKGGV